MTRDEDGFTLIEILIVVSILGLIMSAITSGIIVVTRTFGATADRLAQSHDSQLLSTWLVPDLQSAAAPLPAGAITPAVTGLPCPSGGSPFAVLKLSWKDAADGKAYVATYQVTAAFELARTLTVTPVAGAASSETFDVVHNLEDPAQPVPAPLTAYYPACIGQTADGRVTVTITTLTDSDQFTFSVTAQTRQPYAPPPPLPPADPISVDADLNGIADGIVVQFDQAVACNANPCDASRWKVKSQPGYAAGSLVSPASVVIGGANDTTATLTLASAFTTPADAVDTRASTMKIEMAAGDLQAAAGPVAAFGETPVLDGMAPILVKATSKDTQKLGRLNRVMARFSELLATGPGVNDFKLLNSPDGGDANPTSVVVSTTNALEYEVAFNIAAVDTVAAGAKLRITPGSASDGVKANPPDDETVIDGMEPVLDPSIAEPIVARDVNVNGKADRLMLSFTENLTSATAPNWTFANPLSGATASTVALAGKVATLSLTEGVGAANTATTGFTVALDANGTGLKDAAGNEVTFGPKSAKDEMKPVLSGLTASGGIAGKVEAGDTMSISFSEAVVVGPLPDVITVDRSGSDTIFTLAGLAAVVMNSNGYTSNADLSCTVGIIMSPASANVTLGTCTGVSNPVIDAGGPATPAATVRDVAASPNLAGGSLPIPDPTVLF